MSLSFITLIIFIYQTNLMRKQNYLSILPYVQFAYSDDPSAHQFSFSLKNHGVGPAILESVTLEYQGERKQLTAYGNELFRYMQSLDPALDSVQGLVFSTLDPGIALPANTTYPIITVEGSERDYQLLTRSISRFIEEGLRYEIVYRSIQDERWMIHIDSSMPEKLR
jgi:hypothetical protein